MSPDAIHSLILEYRYWVLIPLAFIEGPIIGFIAGAFSKLGYFNPFFAFSIFIIRDVLIDALFYFLGKRFGRTRFAERMLQKIRVTPDHLLSVRRLWDTHGFRTMFISKLSYGIAQAFLIVAGMVKMPFRDFFRYALAVALVEYGVLFFLGYLMGGAFGTLTGLLSNIQYGVAGLALMISGYYIFSFYMRNRLLKEKNEIEPSEESEEHDHASERSKEETLK